jgi:hypothetical protein
MYKRFETRRSLVIPIELITPQWDEPINLFAGDLSPRGVYVKTDLMPQAGEHVVCSFTLLRGRPEYCFFGEVTRVNMHRRKTDRSWPGFGIEFLDITPLQRLSIRHALRGLPPPIPGSKRPPIQFASVDSLLA